MVQEFEANGMWAREAIETLGRNSSAFSNSNFYDRPEHTAVLQASLAVLATQPDVDDRSVLVTNSTNSSGVVNILSVPAREIILPPLFPDIEGPPPSSMTHLIVGIHKATGEVLTELLLTEHRTYAERLAIGKFMARDWIRGEFDVEARLIEVDKFLKLATMKLLEGEELDPGVLRYAGLRKIYEGIIQAEIDSKNQH